MVYPSQIDPEVIGEVALGLVEAEGWDAFSLRGVAKALGVTPNALYRHIGDRNGLDIAVGAAAASALLETLRVKTEGIEGVDLVIEAAHAYVEFGTTRSDAYRSFIAGKPELDDPRVKDWLQPWRLIRNAVAPLVPLAAGATGIALFALLHGRVDLARGPLRAAAPTDGLNEAIYALIAGYESLGRVEGPRPRADR